MHVSEAVGQHLSGIRVNMIILYLLNVVRTGVTLIEVLEIVVMSRDLRNDIVGPS